MIGTQVNKIVENFFIHKLGRLCFFFIMWARHELWLCKYGNNLYFHVEKLTKRFSSLYYSVHGCKLGGDKKASVFFAIARRHYKTTTGIFPSDYEIEFLCKDIWLWNNWGNDQKVHGHRWTLVFQKPEVKYFYTGM